MFIQACSALLSHCRTDAIAIPRAAGSRRARAESDASEALRFQPGTMLLSRRLADPAAYRALQRRRREMLLALLMVEPTAAHIERITDLICMICEEGTWSRNEENAAFDDENHPAIDLQCAETAVLFGWTTLICAGRLDARVTARMRSETRRRLFKPVLVHDDYDFMHGLGACPMTVAADLLLSALLIEDDEARAGRLIKPALRLLDEACGRHGREPAPLEEAVTDISAATDLVLLLRSMTGGFVDLSGAIPTADWLDEILYPWIQDELFVDPAGSGLQPALSGSDIFRIGDAAGDEPLVCLGAHLHHRSHRPSATVTGRLMELSCADRLESSFGKPQRLRYAATRNNLVMSARMPGLYCALHVGGGRANAGDVCLFADAAPVLTDGGTVHSLPVIAGKEQLAKPERPCIADFEVRDDREIMSVELTHAYPACGLRSYQRTVLTLRGEHTVRIMDALDLEKPAPVVFRFVTATKPAVVTSAVRFGPVRMTWEGSFTVTARPLTDGLTCVEMTSSESVKQAYFAFNFERA